MSKTTQHGQNAPFFVDNEVLILTRNGVWLADGTEITHEPTRKLFSKSLVRHDDGYYLHIGRETKKIQVEDTAYFITQIDGELKSASGTSEILPASIILKVNDETQEELDLKSLSYRPGRLTCLIKGGKEEAKFLHPPYFELLKYTQEDKDHYFIEFQNATKAQTEKVILAKK